jgi:ribose 5-phosphate isomerase B
MRVYLATDHAGLFLKEEIKKYLQSQSFEVEDCGAYEPDENDDYPDYISKAAEKVSQNSESMAVVFGKSGAGETIVANKYKNVRAVLGFSQENVRLARQHNNANVLSLGADLVDFEQAKDLVTLFLTTSFSGEERHRRRLEKIAEIENRDE